MKWTPWGRPLGAYPGFLLGSSHPEDLSREVLASVATLATN
jgi:hypothetical protein